MKILKAEWETSIDYWFDTHCPECNESLQSEGLLIDGRAVGGIDGNETIEKIIKCPECNKKFRLFVPIHEEGE